MTTLTLPQLGTVGGRGSRPDRRHWQSAVALGVVGFLVSVIGIANPSLWGDEAASIMSAERSLPSLFRMLGHVDAVHGTYYLFLHFWIGVFGTSEFSVRFPSAVAVGFLVAGVYLLGSSLATRQLGVVAALIAAIVPRIGSIGGDARSYAISTAIAVWLTLLLVYLVKRGSTRRLAWLGYALGLTLGLYFFLYLVLLAVVHGLYLVLIRRHRAVLRRWLQACALAVFLALPVFVYGYAERAQIAFLKDRNYARPDLILGSQWFGGQGFAFVAWICIAGAVVVGVIQLRRRRTISPFALLLGLWFVVPTAVLLSINAVTPTYNLRYVAMSAPAAALVMAVGIVALRRRVFIVLATAVVIVLAIPTAIGQRQEFANDQGSDWRQVSQYVGLHANPGDAIVFDDTVRNSRLPRLAMHMYPQYYRGLIDVALVTPFSETSGLWDRTASLDSVAPRLDTISRVVLLELRGSADRTSGRDVRELGRLGFTIQSEKKVNRTIVYILTRGTP